MTAYEKIKKYLLILSFLFVVLISVHAGLLYLYSDSVAAPQEGGSITVGMVGDIPTLKPLDYLANASNDFILQFLYRGLIRYNSSTKQFEGDLASCDLSRNFANISCTVRTNNIWSDGSKITKDDVMSTYDHLKKSDANPILKQLLADIDIIDKGDSIMFSAKNADALVLDALMIPIVKSSNIEDIKKGVFDASKMTTSGPYSYARTENDDTTQSKKIILQQNPAITYEKIYISKYNFKFFSDPKTLSNNEDSLGIIYTPNNKESPRSPRFNTHQYILPQYFSLFLNSERVPTELRKLLLTTINTVSFSSIIKTEGKEVINPFFGTGKILPPVENLTFAGTFKGLGYYKKDELATIVKNKLDTAIKAQTASDFGYNFYIKTPSTKKVYFTDKKEVLISGNTPAGVSAVYINDYKLKTFSPGNTKFYYKANLDLQTLKTGVNSYALSFEIDGKKVKKEVFTIYQSDDQNWLKQKEEELKNTLTKQTTKTQTASSSLQAEKDKTMKKIQELDAAFYYDINLTPYTINFSYSNQPALVEIASLITKELRNNGIQVVEKQIGTPDIQAMISKGEKNYDMIITGINLGLFDYNIFPYFHSGQAKVGFNFAKLKNISLDVLLEELRSRQLDPERLTTLKSQILEILKKEAIARPIYTPFYPISIDKNLKGIGDAEHLPYVSHVFDIIKNGYIKESRTINLKNKSPFGFIAWIFRFIP